MIDFKVDEAKCIECGLCAQDCLTGIIALNPKPAIDEEKEGQCFKCQHCLAVCPKGAISIHGKSPEDSIPVNGELPTPEAMGRLIKTRRTIRQYKKENLDKALIHELLETASYAPTAHNSNAVFFSVLDNMEKTEEIKIKFYDSLKKLNVAQKDNPNLVFLSYYLNLWETHGIDQLFCGAPHVVIASAPKNSADPETNTLISLSYFELLANSHGIGTLWNTVMKLILQQDLQLQKDLGIPEDHTIGYVMAFGKPAIKYKRAIQSEGTHINHIA